MIYNSGTYRCAPFTFLEFLGHSFHFLSSVLPPFRPFEARPRPFSLSFDLFSHFLFFSICLFSLFLPPPLSVWFLSSHNDDHDLTWHITKHRETRDLFILSQCADRKKIACVVRYDTSQSTIICDLHSKEQSEKISAHLRFDAAQRLIYNIIFFIKKIPSNRFFIFFL